MQEYKVILTWESIYDVTDIADYIETEFGRQRADRFQTDIKKQIDDLEIMGNVFGKTQISNWENTLTGQQEYTYP